MEPEDEMAVRLLKSGPSFDPNPVKNWNIPLQGGTTADTSLGLQGGFDSPSFIDRLYTYGGPPDPIDDRRTTPLTPYQRMLMGNQSIRNGLFDIINNFPYKSPEQQGHLTADAGYYDILKP